MGMLQVNILEATEGVTVFSIFSTDAEATGSELISFVMYMQANRKDPK